MLKHMYSKKIDEQMLKHELNIDIDMWKRVYNWKGVATAWTYKTRWCDLGLKVMEILEMVEMKKKPSRSYELNSLSDSNWFFSLLFVTFISMCTFQLLTFRILLWELNFYSAFCVTSLYMNTLLVQISMHFTHCSCYRYDVSCRLQIHIQMHKIRKPVQLHEFCSNWSKKSRWNSIQCMHIHINNSLLTFSYSVADLKWAAVTIVCRWQQQWHHLKMS